MKTSWKDRFRNVFGSRTAPVKSQPNLPTWVVKRDGPRPGYTYYYDEDKARASVKRYYEQGYHASLERLEPADKL